MKCSTRYCRQQARVGKSRCDRCQNRAARERDPHRYHYVRMKANAKRRGIAFDLSLFDYRRLWQGQGLWLSGAKPKGWTIDRIDPAQGYTPRNCWLLTTAEHTRKSALEAQGYSVADVLARLTEDQKTAEVPF